MPTLEDLIDDYLSSEHLLFLEAALKEPAEGVLRAFSARGDGARRGRSPRFEGSHRRGHPARRPGHAGPSPGNPPGHSRSAGRLLRLSPAKRPLPSAGSWQVCAEAVAPRFRASLREGGGVKGETVRNASTPVGRNDPCFCGSGLKYKKCCGA